MRNTVAKFSLVVVSMFCFASVAYPWGYANHAYVAGELNKRLGERNENEVYGAMAPDMFNFSFGVPVYADGGLYYQLHYLFAQVWDQKKTGMEKGLGYGFISHNDLWGADYTAHHSGRTYGTDDGYVIAKAGDLFAEAPELAMLVGDEAALELYHTFVEFGLEILAKRVDPMIGDKITSAALGRSPDFAGLLVDAYAEGFAPFFSDSPELAAQVIILAEGEFRETMLLYGQMLMMDEETLLDALSAYLAGFADEYLAANGITLPPGIDLVQVIHDYIQLSMMLCQDDYPTEIRATIRFVDGQMNLHGIGNRQ